MPCLSSMDATYLSWFANFLSDDFPLVVFIVFDRLQQSRTL